MKKFTFTTFDLLKYLIENDYLKGVSGSYCFMGDPPLSYGVKITDEIEELCGKYLESWCDPDFLDEANGLVPIPSTVETTFKVIDGMIEMKAEYTFDQEDYPTEEEVGEKIANYLNKKLDLTEIAGENVCVDYRFVNGIVEKCLLSFEINDVESVVDEKYSADIVKIIHDVVFDYLMSELKNPTINLTLEYGSLSYTLSEDRITKYHEGDFDDEEYEVIVNEEGLLSFSEL